MEISTSFVGIGRANVVYQSSMAAGLRVTAKPIVKIKPIGDVFADAAQLNTTQAGEVSFSLSNNLQQLRNLKKQQLK